MAITVQARQANGEWHVRNAFIDDNKLVIAGSMKKDDLLRKAQKASEQWRAYDDGKQLRVHDSEADVKSAPRKAPAKQTLDRTDYSRLPRPEIERRIASTKSRMDRCVDIDAMVGDMFAVQELQAALQAALQVAA